MFRLGPRTISVGRARDTNGLVYLEEDANLLPPVIALALFFVSPRPFEVRASRFLAFRNADPRSMRENEDNARIEIQRVLT